mmetsp:Transcript_9854/g.16314  ORF Transcript_9854/g.16314 Transcript_9854/m.16314 type:complete len:398 (-) Transcript_9854:129-1322(-)
MYCSWQPHLVLAAALTVCSGLHQGWKDVPGHARHRRRGTHFHYPWAMQRQARPMLDRSGQDANVPRMNKVRAMMFRRNATIMTRFGKTMSTCTKEGKWPPLDKFDLVISWWTKQKQSDIHPQSPSSLLQQSSSSGFENQAEIKYALRSFEKYGLLDHVGTVFLLLDAAVLDKHGAPRFFNYSKTNLRIITDRDLGVEDKAATNGTKWRKFLALDMIPGLSEYFLWLPDDNIMLKPFEKNFLYSQEGPLLYSYGTFSLGWCDGGAAVGSTHGPVLFHKCALKAIADYYWRSPQAPGQEVEKAIDVPCLYADAMRYFWKHMGKRLRFHRECHTNSRSATGCAPFDKNPPLFFDLQGPGVSDEYANRDVRNHPGARFVMPNGVVSFFHDQFPQPSRFELA